MTEDKKIKKAFMRYVTGKSQNEKYLKKKLNFDNKCFAEQVLPESIQREIIKDIQQKEGEKKDSNGNWIYMSLEEVIDSAD